MPMLYAAEHHQAASGVPGMTLLSLECVQGKKHLAASHLQTRLLPHPCMHMELGKKPQDASTS